LIVFCIWLAFPITRKARREFNPSFGNLLAMGPDERIAMGEHRNFHPPAHGSIDGHHLAQEAPVRFVTK